MEAENQEVTGEQGTAQESPTLTPAQEQALSYGWQPREEWTGDPDSWVDAPEYNRRTKLIGQIKAQRQETQELKAALKQMHTLMVKNTEAAYNQAITDIQAQRNAALQEGDTTKVMQLEQQLNNTHQAAQLSTNELKKAGQIPEIPEFFRAWKERNDWYGTNTKRTAYADAMAKAIAQEYQQRGETPDREVVLQRIEEEDRAMFKNGGKTLKAADTLGTSPPTPKNTQGKGKGISSLPLDIQAIARTLCNATGMTEAEYMKSYQLMEGK
jgi:hypothetical protein